MTASILIACDSFKGSMSSLEAGTTIAQSLQRAAHFSQLSIQVLSVADGGEGSLEALLAGRGRRIEVDVRDPLLHPRRASFGIRDDGLCVCEMALSSGLGLVEPELRDPWRSSSYGFGQLIEAALDAGASDIALCLGGSATNDCGMGALRALGMRFYNAQGVELEGRACDLAELHTLASDGLDSRLSQARFSILSDVDAPLLGETGATYRFGPQKFANPALADAAALDELECAVTHFVTLLEAHVGRELRGRPGAGAAGGMGAALMAVLDAKQVLGAAAILDYLHVDEALEGVDLCITGEGRFDEQTSAGKLAWVLRERCESAGVPCALIAGSIEHTSDPTALGFAAAASCVSETRSLHESLAHPHEALIAATHELMYQLPFISP